MAKKQSQKKRPQKQKIEWRRVFVAGLAVVMALLLLLPMISMIAGGVGAVTQSEIDALKEEQRESQVKQQELKNQLADVKEDQAAAQQRRQLLQQQLEAINAELDSINAQISYYDGEIARKEAERRRRRPKSRPSMSGSASGCAPWRRRGRCPTGPSSLTPRTSPTCWTVWPMWTR